MRDQTKGIDVFTKQRTEVQPSPVDVLIEGLVSEMQGYDGHSEEYLKSATSLKVLMEARATEKKPERLSPNTIATVAGNLVGILMILGFERANVITSKGLGFVLKPKI